MAKHDFGIINQFEENKWYCEYEPHKYNCVSVDMKVMDILFEAFLPDLLLLLTFAGSLSQPFHGLEEDGITLIPPTSLEAFCAVIRKANERLKEPQLIDLIDKINEAIYYDKYMIHFGI